MKALESSRNLPIKVTANAVACRPSWSERYGEKHKMVRVLPPAGMDTLRKVRLYRRGERKWLCQWWDPKQKKSLSQSLEGDVIAAISAAREIDERLVATRGSGQVWGKITHIQLMERYREDLLRRTDADELEVTTFKRYQPCLGYYEQFVKQPHVARRYPTAVSIDRDRGFVHELMRFVKQNPLRSKPADPDYMRDVIQGMYKWAQDPDGGNLLPDYFHSPFTTQGSAARKVIPDLLGDPDITMDMAVDLVRACDL